MRKNNKIATGMCNLLLLLVLFLLAGKIAAADLYLNSKTGSIFLNTTESSRLQIESGGNLVVLGNANVTFPANLTVDSGTLFVNSVNNRVGIGNLAPNDALEVIGNVRVSGSLNATSINATNLYAVSYNIGWTNLSSYPSACAPGQFMTAVGDTITCASPSETSSAAGGWSNTSTTTSTSLDVNVASGTFYVNATTRNVGIGTTTPNSPLTIVQNTAGAFGAGTQILNLSNQNTGNTATTIALYPDAGQDFDIALFGSGVTNPANANKAILNNRNNAPFGIFTDNTERLSITGSGNVGIGTTTPDNLLTILGNDLTANAILHLNASDNFNKSVVNVLTLDHVLKSPVNSTGGVGVSILFRATDNASQLYNIGNISAILYNSTNGSQKGAITFSTSGADTGDGSFGHLTERMRIDGNGNVGIGKTNPATKLDVNGGINASTLNISNNAYLATQSGGLVGIGTAIPSGDLMHLVDNSGEGSATYRGGNTLIVQSNDAGNWNRVNIIASSTGSSVLEFGDAQNSSAGYIRYSNNADAFYFSTNSTSATNDKVTIDKDGNVGIGTTSPNYLLQVASGTDGRSVNLSNVLFVNGSSGNAEVFNGNISLRSSSAGSGATSNLLFKASGGGNIAGFTSVADGSASGDLRIFTGQTGTGVFTERMRINENGNVGIGTTSPNFKLDVAGSINASGLNITGNALIKGDLNVTGTSYLGDLDFSGSTITAGTVIAENVNATYLNTSGQTLLAVSGGNVGIGTTNPSMKLVVAGSANITGDLISKTLYDISSQGLVLAMNFNNGSINGDTVLDSSPYNNHGTNSGATFNNTGGFDNLGSGAFSFDGVNGYIDIGVQPSHNFSETQAFTISAWLYNKGLGAVNRPIYRRNGNTGFLWQTQSDGSLVVYAGNGSFLSSVICGGMLNTWNFITEVYNGTDVICYLNGVFVDNLGMNGAYADSATNLIIGSDNVGASVDTWNGTIDEVRIYSRQLSADEINRLYLQRAELPDSFVSQRDVYVDNAGNVGIGTTNPASKLYVNGSSDSSIITADTSATSTEVLKILVNGGDRAAIAKNSGGDLELNTTGSGIDIILRPTGNVGIGTTTPNYLLQVASGTDGRSVNLSNVLYVNESNGRVGIGTASSGNKLTISRDTSAAAYQLELRDTGSIADGQFTGIQFTQGAIGGTFLGSIKSVYYTSGVTDLSFSTRNDADALYIKNGGNVGIGTTSPNYLLQVASGTDGRSVNLSNVLYVNGSTKRVGINVLDPEVALDVAPTASAYAYKIKSVSTGQNTANNFMGDGDWWIEAIEASSSTDRHFRILEKVGAGSGSTSERLRMLHTGQVGINTTSPAQTLTIQGTLNVTPAGQGSTPSIFADSSGNVGIGTTTPTKTLHVIGNANISQNLFVGGNITTGGADFAEMMDSDEILEAGDVVCFVNSIKVKKCSREADRSVAGIVSEKPTIIGNKNNGKYPVGIVGLVRAKVLGGIESYDLLTASSQAGYAKKAAKEDAGAIIGKALEPCKKEKCRINVLVSLS